MRILPALLLAPLLWLTSLALAAEGDLQPIPALRAPVTDVAGVLNPADLDALNRKLLAFSEQQGSQVVVLIVPTTAPEDIFDYSFRVAEAWKPGRKGMDDGIVLVLAINDRRSHMQVGYGLEGAIPDIRAKQILQDIMPPYLRRGDYAGGIDAGTDAVIKLIRGENLPLPEPRQARGGSDNGGGGAIFFAIIAGLIASGIARVVLGRLLGGLAGGAVAFGIALALGLAVGLAVMAALFAMLAAGGRGGFIPGGFGGGGFGRGGFGGFGGGGGSFGGGGASGDW